MSLLTPLENDTKHRELAPTHTVRRIAALMIAESATLAVASALHLSGTVQGRAEPFNAVHAGAAEAVIGAVLAGAAIAMFLAQSTARTVGLAATGFAIAGFLVGLRFTTLGGHAPDVAYHLVLLPVLIASLTVLLRAQRPRQRQGQR